MFGTKSIGNRTFIIAITVQLIFVGFWYLFFPHIHRFLYVLLGILAISTALLIIKHKKRISLFIKEELRPKTINRVVSLFLVLGIVIAFNYVINKNEYRVDITRNKINTLSEQTIKVLKGLDEDVHYIGFMDQATQGAYFRHVMDRYGYYSKRISYEIIDPNKEPLKARAYNITQYGTIVAVKGKDETRIDFMTEEALTNSIIKLTRAEKKKVYFLTGHMERDIEQNEPDSYSSIKDVIIGQGYIVDKLSLLTTGKIPSDINLLVIAGAKKAFFDKEVKLILDSVKKGVAVLVLSDPSLPDERITPASNVNKILAPFGILLNNDVIVDPNSRLFGLTDAMPVVQDYNNFSLVTEDFNEPTVYPFAQSIDVSAVDKQKYNLYELCRTSSSSWGETQSRSGEISFDKGKDRAGPLNVAVKLVEQKDGGISIIVFGNSSFVSNKYISHVANMDIFMNAVSFLLDDQELLAIRPRIDDVGMVKMPTNPAFAMVTVYLIPLLTVIIGVVYWYRRRRR